MKRDRINYFFVGIFVLAMFVVLMLTLFRLTGRDAGAVSYYVQYQSIPGIIEGSTVTFSGYKVGQVTAITPLVGNKSGYTLELAVRQDWRIPEDSVARIVSPGLLSDKQVDIKPGQSRVYLSGGASISGAEAVDMMAAMQNMASDMSSLTENSIKPLIKNIDESLSLVSKDLKDDLPRITANLNLLIENLNSSAERLSGMLTTENEAHVNSFFANADTISKELASLTGDIHSLRGQLGLFVEDAHQLVRENRDDINKTVSGLSNASELLTQRLNTTLYHLDETSRNFSELSRALRENPALIIRGTQVEAKEEKR